MRRLASMILALSACGGDGGLASGTDEGGDGSNDDGGPTLCEAPDGQAFADPLPLRGSVTTAQTVGLVDLAVAGDIVYGCSPTAGVVIWDVTDPTAPAQVAAEIWPADGGLRCDTLALDPTAARLWVGHGGAAGAGAFVAAYDLGDPRAPTVGPRWDTNVLVTGLVAAPGRVYVAARAGGVITLDDAANELGRFADPGSDARRLRVADSGLVVAEGRTGVRVYDPSGSAPVLLGTAALTGTALDLAIDGTTAFVATLDGVTTIALSDPSAPAVLGETTTPGASLRVETFGPVVAFSDWDRLRAVSTDDATELALVLGEPPQPAMPDDGFGALVADGDRLYAASWYGLQVHERGCGPEAPDVSAEPPRVDFRAVLPGQARDRVLLVRNRGNRSLQVAGIETDVAGLSADVDADSIPPGETLTVELRFDPADTSPATGTVTIVSDDPDQPRFDVPVTGNVAGVRVGEPLAPFRQIGIDGEVWDHTRLQGNITVLAYFATW